MQQALLIRFRPLGPWRYGPSDGAHDRVDTLYRSDRLYSAVTLAMRQLGLLEDWLAATARAEASAVALSSLFPYQNETLFAIPPTTLWPPPLNLVTTPSPVFLSKIRWLAAHFVPLSLIDSLLTSQTILADQWLPDAESGCLLRRDRPSGSPFRVVMRSGAAVDRVRAASNEAHTMACVEFEQGCGLWTVARFRDAAAHASWSDPVKAAFRLLADSGFGGGRTKGWGQTQAPEFEPGTWPGLLLPKVGRLQRNAAGNVNGDAAGPMLFWLLSLYSPSPQDKIDWSSGDYGLAVRQGRVEGNGASGLLKRAVRMVTEGCVLAAGNEPVGTAVDVAPEGLTHAVYRSGIALAVLLPVPKQGAEEARAAEEPMAELESPPCAEGVAIPAVEQTTEAERGTEEEQVADGPGQKAEPISGDEPIPELEHEHAAESESTASTPAEESTEERIPEGEPAGTAEDIVEGDSKEEAEGAENEPDEPVEGSGHEL